VLLTGDRELRVDVAHLCDALAFAQLDPAQPQPLIVEGTYDQWLKASDPRALGLLSLAPSITIAIVRDGVAGRATPMLEGFDLVVDDVDASSQIESWLVGIQRSPQAATVFAHLLRLPPSLLAESLAYSTLQSGREHRRWLASRTRRAVDDDGPRIALRAIGRVREITLDRPERHNAFDARMRQELFDALAVAAAEGGGIVLRGAGPSFCSGGDLDEFGTLEDPVHAHHLRVAVSPARLLQDLGPRAVAGVHGWCIGAGIELSAFAHRVIAANDAVFRLPEVGFGLLPGSGGSVSVRRRIGRRRLLGLAVTDTVVDARRALEIGLVDEVVDRSELDDRVADAAREGARA
jgi:enoyl-CoA hydratase/carnithine racemase